METPQAAWGGKELSLAQSTPEGLPFVGGQASVLGLDHSTREEASRAGVQPRMPLAQCPIPGGPDPFPCVGRGPESPRWQSALGQGHGGQRPRETLQTNAFIQVPLSPALRHTRYVPYMPATDSYACIPSRCHGGPTPLLVSATRPCSSNAQHSPAQPRFNIKHPVLPSLGDAEVQLQGLAKMTRQPPLLADLAPQRHCPSSLCHGQSPPFTASVTYKTLAPGTPPSG